MITLLVLFVVLAVSAVALVIAGIITILPFMDFIIAGIIACVVIKTILKKNHKREEEQSQQ